ncbi:hypothetical protein BJ912DRAFT_1048387 [Pholiota molesta]|nr:hypothetical protein BJ912DRAFT_1048387 [Pholiota molesta]
MGVVDFAQILPSPSEKSLLIFTSEAVTLVVDGHGLKHMRANGRPYLKKIVAFTDPKMLNHQRRTGASQNSRTFFVYLGSIPALAIGKHGPYELIQGIRLRQKTSKHICTTVKRTQALSVTSSVTTSATSPDNVGLKDG